MKSLLSVVLFASLSAGLLHGQTAESRHDEICGKYAEVPLPTEAQQASQSKKWPDCESYKIYSGIGMAVDYAATRNCAWLERLAIEARIQPEEMIDAVMGGSAMLAVVYANGEGVEQDKTLALRLACEIGMPADGLNAIEALPDEAHLSGRKFKRCDYAYTTFDMNFCAAFASEIAAQKRQNRLDEISAPWPKAHRDAFAALEKAEKNYVEAHGGEVYQGGTIRVLRTNGVGERQKDKFLAAVEEFESGHLPRGTETDYKRADSDLNATYKQALALAAKQNFEEDPGAIPANGIQDAERAWLNYRDAWVAFAKIHYPATDPNAWLTLLTQNRIWSLRATMCDVGWGDPACNPR